MDCRYCRYVNNKKTSKTGTVYGICIETGLILLKVQTSCKSFKKFEN